MRKHMLATALTIAAASVSAPVLADGHASGDAAAGEKSFRLCQACHVVRNDAGEVLAGRSAKTGPNLYQIAGRTAGTVEGYGYSKSMVEAGEAGLVWDEASFVAYVADPSGFLKSYLDDKGARGKMTFKVRKEADAVNLYAFLAGLE